MTKQFVSNAGETSNRRQLTASQESTRQRKCHLARHAAGLLVTMQTSVDPAASRGHGG